MSLCLFVSVSLCLCVSLSLCVVCFVLCVCSLCVLCVVGVQSVGVVCHAEPPLPLPPRVYVQNALRVHNQNVSVCTGTTPASFTTCGRGAGTHGVLNEHTGVFSVPHHTTRTQHDHNDTRRQGQRETERDREEKRREEKRREEKRREEKRREEKRREEKRREKRQETREEKEKSLPKNV